MLLGYGIFAWTTDERVSKRYGAFYLSDSSFNGEKDSFYIVDEYQKYQGKRVRILARVTSNRKSGHCGDHFIKVYPSTPEVGEEIDLGVGIFNFSRSKYHKEHILFELAPVEPRNKYWMDPRLLYQLHDQTVSITISETTDPPHPVPDIVQYIPDGAVGADKGGTVQFSGSFDHDQVRLVPKVTKIADGLYVYTNPPIEEGKPVDILILPKK